MLITLFCVLTILVKYGTVQDLLLEPEDCEGGFRNCRYVEEMSENTS